MNKLEIIDPTEIVDLSVISKETVSQLPRVALVNLISSVNPRAYPGNSINWMDKKELVDLAAENRLIRDYISDRFETHPGLFGRLHLSLWKDAFPRDDQDYCLKMRFAAAFLDPYKNLVLARTQNRRMTTVVGTGGDRLCSATTCIRDQIMSRTEAVMGDCGHAYLWGIRELQDAGWKTEQIRRLEKYEAGFNPKSKDNSDVFFEPWIGKEMAYTCLYCITVLRWLLGETEVTVFKSLNGQPPAWVDINLDEAFYIEARQMAEKQGLKIPKNTFKLAE